MGGTEQARASVASWRRPAWRHRRRRRSVASSRPPHLPASASSGPEELTSVADVVLVLSRLVALTHTTARSRGTMRGGRRAVGALRNIGSTTWDEEVQIVVRPVEGVLMNS